MRVVRLGAARMEDGGEAVAPTGIDENTVHRVVASPSAGEVEIKGVSDAEIVTDNPAFAGAEEGDVISGGHRGDDAVALGGVPLERFNGEEAAAAGIHVEGIRLGASTKPWVFSEDGGRAREGDG